MAAAALAAVAPTWLAAGRSVRELWAVAVAALPSVPPHRRLMLLGSLLAALPEVSLGGVVFALSPPRLPACSASQKMTTT